MQGLIQVAGIHDQDEADMVCAEGADWVGFALRLPAKNEDLSEQAAADIIAGFRPPHRGVLITYLTEAEEVKAFCAELGVRTVQLHGDVSPDQLRTLRAIDPDLYVLKSLVVKQDNLAELTTLVDQTAEWVDMFITDTFNPATGAKGATGLLHDWDISAELVRVSPRPLMLAGGLNPDNVAASIEHIRPAAVDAHTGLEDRATGRKDPAKVRRFVQQSREAFARLATDAA